MSRKCGGLVCQMCGHEFSEPRAGSSILPLFTTAWGSAHHCLWPPLHNPLASFFLGTWTQCVFLCLYPRVSGDYIYGIMLTEEIRKLKVDVCNHMFPWWRSLWKVYAAEVGDAGKSDSNHPLPGSELGTREKGDLWSWLQSRWSREAQGSQVTK